MEVYTKWSNVKWLICIESERITTSFWLSSAIDENGRNYLVSCILSDNINENDWIEIAKRFSHRKNKVYHIALLHVISNKRFAVSQILKTLN